MATEYERPTEYRSRTEEHYYGRMNSILVWIVAAFAFFAIAALVVIAFADQNPSIDQHEFKRTGAGSYRTEGSGHARSSASNEVRQSCVIFSYRSW